MLAIIQDVIFPIMSHTEADQAQWDSDPYEYIRLKFGKFYAKIIDASEYQHKLIFQSSSGQMCSKNLRHPFLQLETCSTSARRSEKAFYQKQ